MRKMIVAVAAALLTVLSVWIVAGERATNEEAPHRAVIVLAGTHGREGVGKFTAISVSDSQKIARLESFFPNYREFPSSDMAGGWKAGSHVYFDFANGRTVRVTVSQNDDGKTWSIGNGDLKTHGDFDGFIKHLRDLPPPDGKP
jgi:hypothetical protein